MDYSNIGINDTRHGHFYTNDLEMTVTFNDGIYIMVRESRWMGRGGVAEGWYH